MNLAKENKLKPVLAIFAAVASVTFLALTVLDPATLQQLEVSMHSLWQNSDPMSSPDDSSLGLQKKPKSASSKLKQAALLDSAVEPLNLDVEGGLEQLGDELMEDRLWEEGILRSRTDGVRSGQAVLDALAEIEAWSPIESGYNQMRLKMFLRYPKLWVRLAAYAFALKAKAISEKQEVKLARLITLKSRDNPLQVKRFLTRYERKDPDLYRALVGRLLQPTSTLLEDSSEDDEEESQEAS